MFGCLGHVDHYKAKIWFTDPLKATMYCFIMFQKGESVGIERPPVANPIVWFV